MKKKVPTEQAFNKVIQALGKVAFMSIKLNAACPGLSRFGGKKKRESCGNTSF